ncbi:MAG: glycosyltransferase [Candidatus Aminicenantes bacterium]|nr:MAG: glycosyltransferase [Candidatus Aminicenantes bacterium]
MKNVRVALVHDWLTGQRGGEKVLEIFAEIFSDAPIYTLFHFPGSQIEAIERRDIKTSFLQRLPFLRKKYRHYLPLFPLAAELFDLQEYELIISTSHCVAKGIIPHPDSLHICYVHSPIRYAWNQYFSYFSPRELSFFPRILIPPLIHYLRLWDESSSHRVDYFIANSRNVARRIGKYYRRQANVIYPPVDTHFFQPTNGEADYYLIVSALVPYKRIDLAIETFNRTGFPLKIVGQGPDYKKLRKKARTNIEFLGSLAAEDLLQTYQGAIALLMPGEEDFGITSLEAQACGVPVIAYGKGGAKETIIPEKTGLFFHELRVKSFLEALDKFRVLEFNKTTVRANAMKFSRDIFKKRISEFFLEKWSEHKGRQ